MIIKTPQQKQKKLCSCCLTCSRFDWPAFPFDLATITKSLLFVAGGGRLQFVCTCASHPECFFFLFFSLHATTFNYFHFALRVFTTLLWFKLPLQTALCPPETNYLTGLREVSGCQADCSILTVFHVSSGMLTWFVCFPCVPRCLSVHAWCVRA